ncbi:MAG: 30S ribosomal protein S12 methylthiotransferase RimO [Deltaproteobacteria bacterium]|nr:30S ribosomal protein S12 methylthiotransferase RimO [Deltaproteobacteria bacterium]
MPGRLPIIQPGPGIVPAAPSPSGGGKAGTVYFASLGCPKNRTDSEAMLAQLGQAGYEMADGPDGADVIVVNTCTFIDASTQESVDTVLEMAEVKQSNPEAQLVVTGCMAQRHHQELKTELPEVDAFLGTGDYHRILEVVGESAKRGTDIVTDPTYVQGGEARVNTLTPWSAYLKILEGCPQRCTFCIIPRLRGDLMSRPLEVVVDEARALAGAGVKELNLVGQDSNSWGRDLPGKPTLDDLLVALDSVDSIQWVRLLYSYPAKFPDRLIDTLTGLQSFVPYIDMPLQHISDPILKAMRRGVNGERTRRLLDKLRGRLPGLSIRTGFIVGFPGETEAHFDELCDFVREQRFDNVGVFEFSPQEETPASQLPDQIPEEVRAERREALMLLQQEIHLQKNEERVGTVEDVLIEGVHPETELLWVGRTRGQAPEVDGQVLIADPGTAQFGDIVPMTVTEAAGYDLVAEAL